VLLKTLGQELGVHLQRPGSRESCAVVEVAHDVCGRGSGDGVVMHQVAKSIEGVPLILEQLVLLGVVEVLADNLLREESVRRVERCGGISDVLLDVGPAAVEAVPVLIGVLSIRERVISADWPCFAGGVPLLVFFGDLLDVLCRSRVQQLNSLVETESVPGRNKIISDLVVDLCLDEGHVAAEGSELVVSPLLLKLLDCSFVEGAYFALEVVAGVVTIEDDGHVNQVAGVSPETCRPTVAAQDGALVGVEGQDVLLVAEVLFVRAPYLRLLFLSSHLNLFSDVDAREKHGIEAEVSSQSGISCTEAERVHLPADLGVVLELTLQELLADLHVVDDLIVGGGCLVWSSPSSAQQIKLTSLDKASDFLLHGGVLFLPPHVEVLGLGVAERAVLVDQELQHGGVEDVLDTAAEDRCILAREEVVRLGQPALISVRVGEKMDILLLEGFLKLIDLGAFSHGFCLRQRVAL